MTYEKIRTKGKPPCSRFSHASCYLQTDNQKLLLIHGGRNDHNYSILKESALNDFHILNLVTLEWQSLAIYGDIPESRYSHQMCTNERQSVVVIFGGMNLQGFCDS